MCGSSISRRPHCGIAISHAKSLRTLAQYVILKRERLVDCCLNQACEAFRHYKLCFELTRWRGHASDFCLGAYACSIPVVLKT